MNRSGRFLNRSGRPTSFAPVLARSGRRRPTADGRKRGNGQKAVSRSLFKPLQTRSMAKPDTEKPAPSSENESVIRLRGKTVEWRGKPEFRHPVDIRIKKNAKKHDTRSVHAAVNTPGGKLVAFYRGRVLPCSSGLTKISGKWFITIPGCRGLYVLDSQITEDWSWERYLKEGAVAGFFNSSQPFACQCKDPRRRGVGNSFDAYMQPCLLPSWSALASSSCGITRGSRARVAAHRDPQKPSARKTGG